VAHGLGPLRIDLGVRHDDNDAFGERTTPKVGLLLPLGDASRVRASWGEGFRAPSIGELFYPFSGNAELEPEESESWELGVEYEAGAWKAGVTRFDNEFVNLIDFDFATFTNRNVGRAASRGFELWSRYTGSLFSISTNATILETEDLATGEALLRRPRETASLVLIAGSGPWVVSFSAAFVGDRFDVDPVSLERIELGSHLGFDLGARLEKWSRAKPFARIENLADREFQEVAGYPAPGRRVIAGLLSSWQ
jgi:vitamin B12 transporter